MHKGYKRFVWFGLLALTLAMGAAPVFAQAQEVTDDDVNRVARQLYCPQCENITLDACGTAACIAWRKEIRAKLEAGWTDQEISDYFVAQYGQRVLPQPNDPIISFLLVAVPAAVLVLGAAFVVWQMRRRTPAPAPEKQAAAPAELAEGREAKEAEDIDDYYRARLERELKEQP